VTIANETRWAYNESNVGDEKESIFQWAIENIPEDKKVAVANTPGYLPIHLAHYSDLETITIPKNLDDYWLEIFLIDYNISFIFIQDAFDPDCIYDKSISPYKEIFSGNDQITFGEINLNLVYSDSEEIFIYAVELKNKEN